MNWQKKELVNWDSDQQKVINLKNRKKMNEENNRISEKYGTSLSTLTYAQWEYQKEREKKTKNRYQKND